MVGKEFTVQEKKSERCSPHGVCAPHGAEPKCVRHGVHGLKKVHSWKRVHSTIEKEGVELATQSACITRGEAAVCAPYKGGF